MNSLHLLLNEAEREWRQEVRRDFPLRSDTPVIKKTQPNGRDWHFSTDLRSIFAHISNDKGLQHKFQEVITKYWDGTPEELARETLHYLLFHELYHPLEAPFSVEGKDNDREEIRQAIRRGILKAEPNLSPLEQYVKVQASENGVEDFILDNRVFIDNQRQRYFRSDIIPTWDVLEVEDSPSKTNFYTVTRLLYGLLYGPEKTHALFTEKAGKDGIKVAEEALTALIGKQVGGIPDFVPAIRKVFEPRDRTRYQAVERFMAVLGPYIEKGMPQGRADMHGEGAGGTPQNLLQNLLNDMTPEEQQQFVQGLAQESPQALQQAAAGIKLPTTSSISGGASPVDEMKNLDVLATHEYYKLHHPKVVIVGGNKVGESVVVGKQDYWNLQRSIVLTPEQLSRVDLRKIDQLQRRTRLPWLIDLSNGTYRLNEYELNQREIKDIKYVDAQIDVPDLVEFYLDSSGSMFHGTAGHFMVNDGGRFDMLSHVLYGFADALQQGSRQLGKQSKMRLHNFASSEVTSKIIPVDKFWNGDIAALNVLFKPENGYSTNLNITPYKDSQKRTYVVVTDGELGDGAAEREANKLKQLAKNPTNNVVLFEIGATYDLGNAVKSDPNIVYHQVHDKVKMLQAGLEVLLSK